MLYFRRQWLGTRLVDCYDWSFGNGDVLPLFGLLPRHMKSASTIAAMCTLLLAGCGNPGVQSRETEPKVPRSLAAHEEALFIHLLALPIETNKAYRIVTARVYPFKSFAASVGEPYDPFTNSWDGAWTNAKIDKNGAAEARPLEPIWKSGDAVLAGRIDRVNGKFYARLQGRNRTTLNYFHGEIELEKPVYEQGGLYRANVIWGVWFALSASPDCSRFLKELDDSTLQLPLVDKDSPAAKQWEGWNPSGTLQILDAEPDAAPNADPPHR
jgi:hypothetical protein